MEGGDRVTFESWIQPTILVGLLLFVWRDLGGESTA